MAAPSPASNISNTSSSASLRDRPGRLQRDRTLELVAHHVVHAERVAEHQPGRLGNAGPGEIDRHSVLAASAIGGEAPGLRSSAAAGIGAIADGFPAGLERGVPALRLFLAISARTGLGRNGSRQCQLLPGQRAACRCRATTRQRTQCATRLVIRTGPSPHPQSRQTAALSPVRNSHSGQVADSARTPKNFQHLSTMGDAAPNCACARDFVLHGRPQPSLRWSDNSWT